MHRQTYLTITNARPPFISCGERTLKPREIPPFQCWLIDSKVSRCVLSRLALFRDCELEIGIRGCVACRLGSIYGCVDFESDVKELAGQKIGAIVCQ